MFLYIQNFLSPGDYQSVLEEVHPMTLSLDPNVPSRKICQIPLSSTTHRIFTSRQVCDWFCKVFHKHVSLSIPIEYRQYPCGSEGIPWHKDTPYGQYLECVFTLENTSDSETMYSSTFKTYSVWTTPNSLIIVRPNDVWHTVTPVSKGERTILKIAYSLEKNDAYYI